MEQRIQIHTAENQQEIKNHGNYAFPVNVSPESISRYEGGMFLWHWHPEIELTWVMEGEIRYHVNDRQYHLRAGEGLFCNSNAPHSGYQYEGNKCEYLSVTFHPRFLYGYENSILQTKYVDFILSNAAWASLSLSPAVPWQKEILGLLQKIYALCDSSADYELQIQIYLLQIWQLLFCHYERQPKNVDSASGHIERLKIILGFIHTHYMEPISLEDIAKSVNICRSECCRFFKKHMKMTLFEYLMFYRIQQSLPLLKKGESVTKTAGMTGFSNPCYFGKIFKRYMKCSPREYALQGNTR